MTETSAPIKVADKILANVKLDDFFKDDISYGCLRSYCAEKKQEKLLDIIRYYQQLQKLYETNATNDQIKIFLTSKVVQLLGDPALQEHITPDEVFMFQKSVSGNTFHRKSLDTFYEIACKKINLQTIVDEWKKNVKTTRQFLSSQCKMKLNDEHLIFYYEKFLALEYSSENLDFFHTIKKYESLFEPTGSKNMGEESMRSAREKGPTKSKRDVSSREPKEPPVTATTIPVATSPLSPSPRNHMELPPLKGVENPELDELQRKRRRDAAFIINLYVAEDAPLQVNIPGSIRKEIETYRDGRKDPTRDLFQKAWNDLYKMLMKDSWVRFKRSEHYKEYLESFEPTAEDLNGKTPSEYRRQRFIQFIGSDTYETVMQSKIGRDCLNKFNQAIKKNDGTIDFLNATEQYSREPTRAKALEIFKTYIDPTMEGTNKMDVSPECLAHLKEKLQQSKIGGYVFDEAINEALAYIEKNKIFERFKMTSLYTKYRFLSKQMTN